MPSLGRSIDRVVGGLSRLLHVRSARLNTIGDLGPYLEATLPQLFPTPVVPVDLTRRRPALSRRSYEVEKLEWRSEHVPLTASYRSRHDGEYARNQTATARWIHPHGTRRTHALVYVHGWLEPAAWRSVFLPRLYEALDVDVVGLQLPFHGGRNPKSALFHGELFWTGDLVRTFEALRQSCIDARTLVAWLRARGYAEVGVAGVSMGGAIAMVLACLDPTPDYIVPIIGHLQLAAVVEEAPIFWRMKADLERFGVSRDQRRELFGRFGLDEARPTLAPERQLWIMARDDQFILRSVVERQWRDWGCPHIEWIDGGHVTFALSLPRIVERVRQFREGLARPPLSRSSAS